MTKNSFLGLFAIVAFTALCATMAQAQNRFLMPTTTQVDGNNAYVTIDSATAENLFNFDRAQKLDGLTITDPDGNPVAAENQVNGRTRSSFDVKVGKPGTYKISSVTESVRAFYRLPPGSPNTPPAQQRGPGGEGGAPGGGEPGKGAPGGGEPGKGGPGGPGNGLIRQEFTAEAFKSVKLPDDASNLRVTKSHSRMETFITNDRANNTVFKPSGIGLELSPVTHPNDLQVKQKATFRMLLNGKPAANLPITLTPSGARYRGMLKQIRVVTDAQGQFNIAAAEGGMYWLNTSYPPRVAQAEPPAGAPPPAPLANAAPIYEDAYSYGAALEVLY